ncbi:hypothetical protein LCGC14_3030740 [marine sediment metagenome]|uniref:Uncharacterized protein n=1 Tax=marine sediment metagenome TaxID=412755 RepID=A0A0F8ZIL8_9ZZZZ
MSTFYISFGQVHRHVVNDVVLDKDVLLRIEAPSEGEARQRVFDTIGNKWFTSYDEASVDFEYFPGGAVEVPGLTEVASNDH